ncbi:MAG: DUF3638 domain-containing protein [Verrucomicrobiota bacterium]|nr:DUF3638 domain-containing protein [Verrucomicrobiota bacterium]
MKEGLRHISQTVASLSSKGLLTPEETASISREFATIRKALAEASHSSQKLSYASAHPKITLKEGRHPIPSFKQQGRIANLPTLEPLSPIDAEQAARNLNPALQEREPIPFQPREQTIDLAAIDQAIQASRPTFSPENLLQNLSDLVQKVQDKIEQPFEVQYEIIEAAKALPLFLENDRNRALTVAKEIVDNPWKKLTPAQRLSALQQLTELSHQLSEAVKKTNALFPDRIFAISRIIMLSEYLARLDETESKMTPQITFPYFRHTSNYLNSIGYRERSLSDTQLQKKIEELDLISNWHYKLYADWLQQRLDENIERKDLIKRIAEFKQNPRLEQLLEEHRQLLNQRYHAVQYRQIDAQLQQLEDKIRPLRNQISELESKLHKLETELKKRLSQVALKDHKREYDSRKMKRLSSPYTQCLLRQSDDWSQLSRLEHRTDFSSFNSLSNWGLSVDHPTFEKITSSFHLSKDGNEATQEAVMANPKKAIDRSIDRIFHRFDDPLPSTDLSSSDISKEQLQEFLLTFTSKVSVWNVLGLIERSPYLLAHPDTKAALEILFANYQTFKSALEEDPELSSFLPKFFAKQIQKYWEKKQPVEAIFLLRLAHTLRFNHPALSSLNFEHFLQEKLSQSFAENSQWKDLRHPVLTEYLWSLQHKATLTDQEARDLVFYGFLFENFRSHPHLEDPILEDEIRKHLRDRLPLLLQKIESAIPSILDDLCLLKKIALPREQWTLDGTTYRSGPLEIDLIRGMLNDESSEDSLPSKVCRSPHFQRLFSHIDKNAHLHAKLVPSDKGIAYAFIDRGVEWHIEIHSASIEFYRKEGKQWLHYVKPERLPEEKRAALLPSLIRKQHFFASVKNPSELWTYNDEGNAQFRLSFKTPRFKNKEQKTISVVTDLRPGRPRGEMHLSSLSLMDPPLLHPLLGIEKGEEILVWSKGREIQEIEIPRHNLRFQKKGATLVCLSPPFENFELEQHPETAGVSGLPSFLLLRSPQGATKLLVPHFNEGHFFDQFSSPILFIFQKMGPVLQKLALWAIGKIPQESEDKIPLPASRESPKHFWQFADAPPSSYFTIDLQMENDRWSSATEKETAKALLDLLKYALSHTEVDSAAAVAMGKRLLKQIKLLPAQAIDPEDLEKTIQMIGAFSMMGNPLLVSESYPETVALSLQMLLVLQEKAPSHMDMLITPLIIQIAKSYWVLGKHLDQNLLLDKAQEKTIRALIQKEDPSFMERIEGKKPSVPEIKQTLFKHQGTPLPLSEESIADLARLSLSSSSFSTPLFSKDPSKLRSTFRAVYKALQSPTDSLSFQSYRATLKSLFSRSEFADYIEMLFDAKAQQKPIALPAFPDLSPLKKEFKGKRYTPLGKDTPQYEAFQKKQADAEKALSEFARELAQNNNLLSSPPVNPPSQNSPHLAAIPSRSSNLAAALPLPSRGSDVADALSLLESSLFSKSWQHLEAQIHSRPLSSTPLIQKANPTKGLFFPQELDPLFPEKTASHPELPSLEPLLQSEEPSLRRTAQTLQDQLQTYQKKKETLRTIGDLSQIQAFLSTKTEHWKQKAAMFKQRVDDLLIHSSKQFSEAEKAAGLQPLVGWNDLKTAFLQNQIDSFATQLRDVEAKELHNRLTHFFQAETLYRHACFAQREVDAAIKENLLGSSATAEKLFRILSRSRCYDIQQFPQLLILEDTLGFLMDQKQIEMVQNILNDPHAIAQAVTGAGKTSVIMVLLGLMKANGTNLVTLKFLDPLFAENEQHLKKMLNQTMKKKVTSLLFTTKTPLSSDNSHGKTSLFKTMYEDLLTTIKEQGCVLTNRRSFPLLESKFLSILYKVSQQVQSKQELDQLDQDHIFYLAKILKLLRERQECIFDEHDKALYPRDELHLALGEITHPPKFAIETIKEIFDLAIRHPDLHLSENIQAELPRETRQKVLEDIAEQLAEKWRKEGIDPTQSRNYFLGLSDEVTRNPSLTPDQKDKLALAKDLFLTYLPVTLSHTAHQKYILSKEDGVSVIPCEYTEVPREGSQFDNVIERLTYATQYYYQKGISLSYLKQWTEKLRMGAQQQMEKEGITSLAETDAQKVFATYFPGRTLSWSPFSDAELQQLRNETTKPETISGFLDLILPEFPLQVKKVSIDAQNQVSMSKASAGISATKGCEKGLHSQFTLSKGEDNDTPQMIFGLLERTKNTPLLYYSSAHPREIIASLHRQKPELAVTIDGAGVLLGVSPEDAADQLLNGREHLKAVSYFDSHGHPHTLGDPSADFSSKGQHFSHPQSRGANVKLSPSLFAALLLNGRDSLEVVLQNAGRLRHPDHKLALAVSNESGITSQEKLLLSSIAVLAEENSDNLFRSMMQKPRDIVRSEMLIELLSLASQEGGLLPTIDRFFEFQDNSDLLISTKVEDWTLPGNYFASHQQIQRKDKRPATALQEKQEEYLKLSHYLNLNTQQLEQHNPAQYTDEMPRFVWNNSHLTMGQQAQVETEQQTQVQQQSEIQVQTLADQDEEPSHFADWINHFEHTFQISPFATYRLPPYDPQIAFTENFFPNHRSNQMLSATSSTFDDFVLTVSHLKRLLGDRLPNKFFRDATRSPHDSRQNRLHYIALATRPEANKPLQLSVQARDSDNISIHPTTTVPIHLVALDQFDAKTLLDHGYRWGRLVYDTRLRRFITTPDPSLADPHDLNGKDLFWYVKQMRELNANQAAGWNSAKIDPTLLQETITPDTVITEDLLPQPKFFRLLAQLKFEDGQYQRSDYSDEEWQGLQSWLQEHSAALPDLQEYFLNDILKSRPYDQQLFPHSALAKLFEELSN